MGSIFASKIQNIAIVGGGPSGLATAKYLLAEKAFTRIQIFEQSDTIQGAWKHTSVDSSDKVEIPQTNPYRPIPAPKDSSFKNGSSIFTTPMYDRLETNIPHQLMGFAEKPFPEDSSLYPSRQAVSRYLEEYSEDILHIIKFHTQVQDVHFVDESGRERWRVTTKDLFSGEIHTETFDAVVVCSGHYDLPYIPDVPGMKEWSTAYPETISHSKFYRSPDLFSGQKVVVVGNSASGMDIANQIASVSKHPLLISQRSLSWLHGSNPAGEESRQETLPQIEEYLDPSKHRRAVRFADGRIETDIDKILYCTGYIYYFPFLSSFLKDIVGNGLRVHNIYKYIFYKSHSSLAFVGLPIRVLPFPLAEVQGAVIAKVWSEKLSLPGISEMETWETETIVANGEGKRFLILDDLKDFKYHNELYDWASQAGFTNGAVPKRWSEKDTWFRSRFPEIKKAYVHHGEDRYSIRTPEELGIVYDQTEE